jgi:hypothetical protein
MFWSDIFTQLWCTVLRYKSGVYKALFIHIDLGLICVQYRKLQLVSEGTSASILYIGNVYMYLHRTVDCDFSNNIETVRSSETMATQTTSTHHHCPELWDALDKWSWRGAPTNRGGGGQFTLGDLRVLNSILLVLKIKRTFRFLWLYIYIVLLQTVWHRTEISHL